jgi:hypothetical protein
MRRRGFIIIPGLLLLVILLIFAAGCTMPVGNDGNPGQNTSTTVQKVEIYHFHPTRQCYSCITLGAYAEETVNTYFAPEVKSGKVVFGHVNMDLPENRALVDRYGPTSSSLWIGVYDKDGFHKEENVNVWYKIGNKDEYMAYLKGIIEKRLAGDFS